MPMTLAGDSKLGSVDTGWLLASGPPGHLQIRSPRGTLGFCVGTQYSRGQWYGVGVGTARLGPRPGSFHWQHLQAPSWPGLPAPPSGLTAALSPRRLEQPYFSANAQFFQALSQCPSLQRLCLVSRSGTLQPDAVLAFMARCLHVVMCHLFTGESLATCKSLQQSLLRR